MAERQIVLMCLHDGARAARLATALEESGDFFATPDRGSDADVMMTEEGDTLHIVLATSEARPEVRAALPEDAEDQLVLAAVRLVAAGFNVARAVDLRHDGDEEQASDIDGAGRRGSPPAVSAREIEVLHLLADGSPNKVIARKLGISVHTAKFHVASLLSKLGAANRTDAIAIAMREGLVPV